MVIRVRLAQEQMGRKPFLELGNAQTVESTTAVQAMPACLGLKPEAKVAERQVAEASHYVVLQGFFWGYR
jgi:hypothetical protein